jgi:hypothetical protein
MNKKMEGSCGGNKNQKVHVVATKRWKVLVALKRLLK